MTGNAHRQRATAPGVRASRGGVITGRVLLAVAVLATLPAFIAAVISIWER